MARRPPDLEPDPSDALYALPLEEFVEARNRLAADISKGGDKARAAAIKGLAKPSVSAWAANQIYWHDRELFENLARAVRAARQATGAELRDALDARRQALVAAGRRAAEILATAGGQASPETLRRISNTLEAVTTLEPTNDIRPGRLTRDIDPPGFDALAGWTPTVAARSGTPARVLEFKSAPPRPAGVPASKAEARKEEAARKAALDSARAAVGAAEKALAAAQREVDRAERAAAAASKKAEEAERERRDLEARLAKATASAQITAREARELERASGAAALALRQAEIELARAKGKVPPE